MTQPQRCVHPALRAAGTSIDDELRGTELVARCEAPGLASGFLISDDFQYRVMRMALEHARSITMDGEPAVTHPGPGLVRAGPGGSRPVKRS